MRRIGSPSGAARGVWIVAGIGAVAVAVLVAGRLWLSRTIDPDEVASRIEAALGTPVAVEAVHVSLLRGEAVIRGLDLPHSARVESAVVGLDLAAALGGRWKFRRVDLLSPVWRVPRSAEDWEVFAKSLMIPLALATRADLVTLADGSLVEAEGGQSVAAEIDGEMTRGAPGVSKGGIDAKLTGHLSRVGEFSISGVFHVSEEGDSVEVEDLRVSALGLRFEGSAGGSFGTHAAAHAEISTGDFQDGALSVTADLNERGGGPFIVTRLVLEDVDGAALLRDRLGLALIESGRLSGDVTLEGDALSTYGVGGLSGEGEVTVLDAGVDAEGLLCDLIPVAPAAGAWVIESGATRFEISRTGVVIRDMRLRGGGMTWTGSGVVPFHGEISGALLGRVPAGVIGGEGTALALVASLLADRDGRVPAAFSVAGPLEHPAVAFDLERTAEAAAAAGRPEAKRLIGAMSRSEREKLGQMVDEYLRRLRGL